MALSQLPAELLHFVCSYCPAPEIRSLRLTSRFVSAVADEHFLSHVTVFYLREEFETIEQIVSNPRIAKSLCQVRFQSDRLTSWSSGAKAFGRLRRVVAKRGLLTPPKAEDEAPQPDEDDRQRRQRHRNALRRKAPPPPKLSAKEAEFQHLKLYSDQSKIMEEARAQLCLERLLAACPKLESVSVAMMELPCSEKDDWLAPAPWYCVRTFRQLQVTPWGDDLSSRILLRPPNEALMAATATGRKLKALTLSPISFQFFDQDEETMAKLYAAISDLESVHVCINGHFKTDRDEEEVEARAEEMENSGMDIEDILDATSETVNQAARRVMGALGDGRVARFLQHAPKLREITLRGPCCPPNFDLIDLEDLVGADPPWEGVTVLRLHGFVCRWEKLVDLILKYRDTLEHLELDFGETKPDFEWPSVWKAIAGQLPKLKHVKLDGGMTRMRGPLNWSGYAPEEVERYIKEGGDPVSRDPQ